MNQEVEQKEIKPLIYKYMFHVILFILYYVLHLIMYSKLYWIVKIIGTLFQICSYFIILYFAFPLLPLIIIMMRNYKKNIIAILKTMTFILLIITILFGLILFILFVINIKHSKEFCRECPFYLNTNHLRSISNSHDLKNECTSRRCVIDQEDLDQKFPFLYLCNYNPTKEFDDGKKYKRKLSNGTYIISDKQLICDSFTINYNKLYFSHLELNSYIDSCNLYTDFYICERFNKPEKKYNIKLKEKCPDNKYLILIYILCTLIFIFDVIIGILPWILEYRAFKKILIMLNTIIIIPQNSKNSTAKSSVISKNENEESFKKEETPVIMTSVADINNERKINQDDELVLKIQRRGIKINHINLQNGEVNEISEDKEENEKDENRINIAGGVKSTDRAKLNIIKLDVNLKKNEQIRMNAISLHNNRKKILANKEDTTGLNTNSIKPSETKIDNKKDES